MVKRITRLCAELIIVAGAAACILVWLEIKPKDLRMTATWPHWLWLICGLILFALGIGLSLYSFFAYRKDTNRLKAEIVTIKEEHKLQLAASERQQKFELGRASQIRGEALAEAHTAKERIAELGAQLAEAKEHVVAPPDDLPVVLAPTTGPSPKQFLIVTNKGERQRFHAQCIVLDEHSAQNIITTFDLGWEDRVSKEVSLAREESHKLLIARAWDDRTNELEYICLCKLGDEEDLWERWNRGEKPTVSYKLEIRIFGEHAVRAQQFIVRPGGKSAIEMYEI